MSNPFGEIGKAQYVQLTTFRKDGTPVGTPVWAAPDGDRLVVWSATDTWKIKRLRRNAKVSLTVCDARGKLKPNAPTMDGTAEVLDSAGTERVRSAIAKKYGILGWGAVYGSRLLRGKNHSIGISIAAV